MGSGNQARWDQKCFSLFASLALLGLAGVGGASNGDGEHAASGGGTDSTQHDHNNCEQQSHASDRLDEKRHLLLVSTLDGKVSALNLQEKGRLEWVVDAGAIPLLSSTISNLEMMRSNVPTRLIPSLDGSLFQFDAENQIIEALPFTADTLLSSSFRLNYDSTIVGGKESATYGVEARTGKVRYICNVDGCTTFEAEATADTGDVIVLTRHTKTVRAVEMRSGVEKWNFSVGQHEVALMAAEPDHVPHLAAASHAASQPPAARVEGDEDASVQSCSPEDEVENEDWFEYIRASMFTEEEFAMNDLDLKVIVPHGLVIAFSNAEPGHVMWKYKFDTAIANAWLLAGKNLSEMSLFNDKVVPALVDEELVDTHPDLIPEPLIYIGIHEEQFYVQPSVRLHDEVRDAMNGAANGAVPVMPRIRWQPYIATAPSRTPAVARYNPLQIGFVKIPLDRGGEDSLTVWQDQYPFDTGWYLMSDTSPIHVGHLVGNADNRTSMYRDVTRVMWNWKEVIAVSLLTSLLFHLVVVRCFPRRVSPSLPVSSGQSSLSCEKSHEEASKPALSGTTSNVSEVLNNNNVASPDNTQPEYISRFATEFEPKQCLGRGGFGVVFEALNQMDDCTYAVKRIPVNNSKRAREKVMREVKALAKLEHPGIVRYYQAWFENPPSGWQEKRDSIILDMSSGTPTTPLLSSNRPGPTMSLARQPGDSTPLPTGTGDRGRSGPEARSEDSTGKEGKKRVCSFLAGADANNPLKIFGGLDRWGSAAASSISGFSQTGEGNDMKRGGSDGFIPKLNTNGSILDESWSNSFGSPNQRNLIDNSLSIDIEFHDSQGRSTSRTSNSAVSSSECSGKPVPFSRYDRRVSWSRSLLEEDTNDSFNIVFEDSGFAMNGVNGEPSNEELEGNYSTAGRGPHDTQSSSCVRVIPAVAPRTARPDSLAVGGPRDTDSVVELGVPKLYLYIQMQLCRQDSLKDWLNCNTLRRDRRELLDTFDQIVSAVDYIHDIHGLMHRDLKPSNIFFSLDGTVKVGDFGLVTALEEEIHTPAASTPQHGGQHGGQHTGQVGTRLYMSPEQVAGHSYNHKVDIFSLGLIFFELFYPFATQMERINTLLEARKGNLPSRFVRELPNECVFVRALLNTDPDQRPTTKEIQQNPLLCDFEAARQTISRVRPRTRTTSSSGSANSLSSSH